MEFNIISSTSMSCPHVAGLAVLAKAAHLDWSPAAIKSALMTTAYVADNLMDEGTGNRSTEWAYESGHVVYDLTVVDYLDFMCISNYGSVTIRMITKRRVNCSDKTRKPWDLNCPSISVVLKQSGRVILKL
ncbi:putative Subtilisin-like protease SBT1.5 [Cocos nucifera]|nr:putative Subtilisin-like protease SBT1.5 [Cocos nucifera]